MQDLKSQLENQIATEKVMVYSKSYCPYCVKTKDKLKSGGVQFVAVEMDQVANGGDIQNTLQGISGQRTVPNVFVGGKHVGGNDDVHSKISNG
mmetsp:Transcript_63792/g.88045  ORF Transcript_63792/g.88045 Transcript_63792/m.88045 type:complete len:93 (+) Transcript_63792:55-333(+)|eukprot:CAMPEP_0176340440 /NCGR_PEP_ID=MMETSP0126-20121128/1568_1 /TAXON_ID=141414 ORGANISM="Strombidinopsis acuminatum, Strain SPMC142" /NCGR_SAMPLE_ID=MMETSP0126 /ASSEMBLY_ACC=CAM_ASM_000229 /LENGTH=92 /DNA_ID=CAMNT_0017684635 /DNA_START=30 /DNA_END=308 /DNA_ORIENTATION=+